MDDNAIWKIIDSQFEETPQHLVLHHIESYNDFFNKDIYDLFRDQNPLRIVSGYDEKLGDYKHKCNLYFGGKSAKRIYYGKPMIYDKDNTHYMYPNEARLRNMTYAMTIHYDVEVEFVDSLGPEEQPYEIGPEFLGDDIEAAISGGGHFADSDTDDADSDREFHGGEADDQSHFNYKTAGGIPLEQLDSMEGGAGGAETNEKNNEKKNKTKRTETNGPVTVTRKQLALTPELARRLREAKEQSLTYSGEDGTYTQRRTMVLSNIYLGRFPVMVQSHYCILNGMSKEIRYGHGECKNDIGGYFIIQGKEKTVVIQEKFGDNMLYIKKGKIYRTPEEEADNKNIFAGAEKDEKLTTADDFLYSIEIRSVSENVSKPQRTLSVKLMAPTSRYSNMNIVVKIPNVRAPVPLFIVFRALGIISDYDIIETCLLDTKKYEFLVDAFSPSVHDAGLVHDQHTALNYIAELTKFHHTNYAMEILNDYFLPHVGESNYYEKAMFLGHMVFRLLCAQHGLESATDRDNLRYKRVELFGVLFRGLFNEYFDEQLKYIYRRFDELIYFNNNQYEHDLAGLISNNYIDVFSKRFVDEGVRRAFRGKWGGKEHTQRVGIVQDLNRLSFNSALSHLRKMNLPLDSSVKLVGPRVLHNSHWGYIDPIDTPDGANIGIHKTMAISTYISRGYSRNAIIEWLKENTDIRPVTDFTPKLEQVYESESKSNTTKTRQRPKQLAEYTKVFVNGYWCGSTAEPTALVSRFRLWRRNALIPLHTSIAFDIRLNAVYIYTDAGRICRPIFYKDELTQKLSFENSPEIAAKLAKGDFRWSELVAGFNTRRDDAHFHTNHVRVFKLNELYALSEQESKAVMPSEIARFIKNKSVVEYVDPHEVEYSLIALSPTAWEQNPKKHRFYTHMEIHHSYLFGTMCNQVILPENNPAVRISFSCSQSRQACSLYHTNYQNRMDKTAVVLNTPQIPLLKSRYYKHLHNEENNYGENVIVAIMCLNGYNVEDAILVNQGALDRGLFHTTYYTSYQTHEERSSTGDNDQSVKAFTQVGTDTSVVRLLPGRDYSQLDSNGLIREGTPVNDQTILIGLTASNSAAPGVKVDESVAPKKGQLGVVDRAFITVGEEGERIAKVRVRETRIPFLGDKMASRAGQKGTVGMVVAEADMPFTKNGLRPDLIINPHALPTRQTIGHLVECLIGKVGLQYGAFNDCTAFNNEGSKVAMFGEILSRTGYHSSGNEIFYDGMSGRQIEMETFVGPNYYMRLKHMVKDKINYRAKGRRSALTRQTVGGRANDGGLRIGEMERDVLVAHGINNFLSESMMSRGDEYQMVICNKTGMMAIYNPAKKQFLSPAVDGPLQFHVNEADRTTTLNTISQFGRSFSVVSVPYSLKLLMQELQAINVHMRIITEDNIEQIANMSYSDNIQRLTMDKDMTPKKLAEQLKVQLKTRDKAVKTPASNVSIASAASQASSVSPTNKSLTNESPTYEYPTNDSPAYEYPTNDSPAYESPTYEYPTNEYLTNEYPTNEYPTNEYLTNESPVYVPESSPSQSGGSLKSNHSSSMEDFRMGDHVYFLNSKDFQIASDQVWTITKKGDRLLTIQCPPEFVAAESHGEYIQLVKPTEIIKVNSPEGARFRQYMANLVSPNHPKPNPNVVGGIHPMAAAYQNGGIPPTIQVAPVIKIMNGNNNTMKDDVDAANHDAKTVDTNDSTSSSSSFTDFMDGSKKRKESKSEKQSGGASNESENASSFGGALADFGKLVINKLT